jgi:hypothetical protein
MQKLEEEKYAKEFFCKTTRTTKGFGKTCKRISV